jgi:hypothetical protein
MKKLSEAGLLTPLLEDLSRNIKLAQKEPRVGRTRAAGMGSPHGAAARVARGERE